MRPNSFLFSIFVGNVLLSNFGTWTLSWRPCFYIILLKMTLAGFIDHCYNAFIQLPRFVLLGCGKQLNNPPKIQWMDWMFGNVLTVNKLTQQVKQARNSTVNIILWQSSSLLYFTMKLFLHQNAFFWCRIFLICYSYGNFPILFFVPPPLAILWSPVNMKIFLITHSLFFYLLLFCVYIHWKNLKK